MEYTIQELKQMDDSSLVDIMYNAYNKALMPCTAQERREWLAQANKAYMVYKKMM